MYSSCYMIIKCANFEPIHDAINLDVVSSSKVFIIFDMRFYRMYIVKLSIFTKKKKKTPP